MSGTISQNWCTNWTKVNTSSWETVFQDFGQNGGLQLRGLNSKNKALEIDREKTYVWRIKWDLLVHALKRCFIHIYAFNSFGYSWTTFFEFINNNNNTVEPPVSDHPRCKEWVVAYGRWSFTRTEPRGVSSEKKSRHIFFMEDNLLHALSKLGYQWSSMLSRKFLVYSN